VVLCLLCQDQDDICDLIFALHEDSVLGPGGEYQGLGPGKLVTPSVVAASQLEGGKVAAVCRALRASLQRSPPAKALKAIVTSLARYAVHARVRLHPKGGWNLHSLHIAEKNSCSAAMKYSCQ
jgi:hypothetical protein